MVVMTVAVAGIGLLASQWNAFGQDQPKEAQKPVFQKMDASGDGKVTTDEYAARRKAWFKEMDENGDGKLSPDEFLKNGIKNMDTDNDDDVKLDELIIFFVGKENQDKKAAGQPNEGKKTEFEKMDINGDGELTVDEIVVFGEAIFKKMDANGDGKVLADEFKAHKDKLFKEWDANGDGFIVVEELVIIPVKEAK
jgi:Ca2+-binding EF-hand superfamily protein